MLPSLEQTDNEILAELKGTRTLEVFLRVIEQGREQAASDVEKACHKSESVDGLARTWVTWGRVLNLIRGRILSAAEEIDK